MTQEMTVGGRAAAARMSMPRILLHIEGAALLAVAVAAYFRIGQPWWLFLVLLFAPDLSALGYLAGPRVGAAAYNAVHTVVGPLALGAAAWILGWPLVIGVALIWLAHIGLDRALGYGLKYPDRFKHTHFDEV